MNDAMGRLGSDKPARERWIASVTACTASSWPTTAFVQLVRQVKQLLALALLELGDGDAGPLGDDVRDVRLGDLVAQQIRPRSPRRQSQPPPPPAARCRFIRLPYLSSAALFRS
jgi:hypothetical protein